MDFFLPDDYDPKNFDCAVGLRGAKENFLEHYARLEKQRFLHSLTQEFLAQPALTQVTLAVYDEGQALDVSLDFVPEFDQDLDENYFVARATENALLAAYSVDLAKFCDNRAVHRSQVLNEDGSFRYKDTRELLVELELADLKH